MFTNFWIFINNNRLKKQETELKNLKDSFHSIVLSKGTIFPQKCWLFPKKMLTYKGLGNIFENDKCVRTYVPS